MKNGFVFIFFLLTVAVDGLSQNKQDDSEPIVTKLEIQLAKMEKKGFSGAVLMAINGQKTLSQGYGYSNRATKTKNLSTTVFDIGSITKQFTAAGILKLEMQGHLSTNDRINKYLAGVPSQYDHITIHHLLTHSGGFPGAIGRDYEQVSEADFLKTAFSKLKKDNIGNKYDYSNVGYSLLALIIEKVSGEGYEAFLRKNLFLPANMKTTGYLLPKWDKAYIAVGYSKKDVWGTPLDKNWDTDGPYLHLKGNGGILSTVEDMYKWHLALLNEQILSVEAKQKYYKAHIKEDEEGSSFYGYGWALFPTPRDTQLIAHNGGNGIFFADFWRYLTEDIVIIILSNKSNSLSEDMAAKLARIILSKTS